jgi:hypothetical protein
MSYELFGDLFIWGFGYLLFSLFTQKKAPGIASPTASRRPDALFLTDEERQNDTNQGGAFYEGGRQDHVRTNVARGFRLAGNGFHCLAADLTDTDTCANYGEAGSDCCVHIVYIDCDN